ncbi:MAG: glycosyltransferase [Parcubacteria group bacterium Gr01-1014_18]|nr:MAG: glycosyltransferase [Parcubacteria group bacterium Greene0416_36]TSC81427.1 MAG: glycosyltransferase [Parcubacteria group bacterium Gr01-1014_18]TSC99025.1 MAG: glycosyltransferase [Parcubacteria group bacterium Greene1014_20]TSD07294.1 MAG: glycosyltransferase [Parcubacteria group bacterium Greene0714_2]
MKILLISNLYDPYIRGGAETIAKIAADGLSKKGHEVIVFSSRPYDGITRMGLRQESDTMWRLCPVNLFSYYYIGKYPYWIRLPWHVIDLLSLYPYFALRNLIRQIRPDVILTHNLKGLGYQTTKAIHQSGIPWIHTLHDIQLVEPSGVRIFGQTPAENLFIKAYVSYCRYLFGKADMIVSPSQFLIDFYRERKFFAVSDVRLLRNPVPVFPKESKKTKSGKWNEIHFLYVGQIEKHKGVEFMLHAFFTYLSLVPEFWKPVLHVVGDGSLLEAMKLQYEGEGRIIFYGRIPHDSLGVFFSQSDFLLFPSLCFENAPAVILEALGSGIPVIASKIGGSTELLVHGENGFIFTSSNLKEFLDILLSIPNYLDRLDDLKSAARESVRPYTKANYTKTLEGFIDELL